MSYRLIIMQLQKKSPVGTPDQFASPAASTYLNTPKKSSSFALGRSLSNFVQKMMRRRPLPPEVVQGVAVNGERSTVGASGRPMPKRASANEVVVSGERGRTWKKRYAPM